uniref:Ig-like domain-containing protein n=1 Tax=Astyanax mexicanus TaxID=7994 RepID=A0A8B9L6W3_ASTMX
MHFWSFSLYLLCIFTGVAEAEDVTQPSLICAETGQLVTIDCKHNKGRDYNQMYWYRQHRGESMKLVVFKASYAQNPEFGDEFDQKKYSTVKTVPESGSLTVDNLDSADSAVYFCAVKEHSVTNTGRGCTKT